MPEDVPQHAPLYAAHVDHLYHFAPFDHAHEAMGLLDVEDADWAMSRGSPWTLPGGRSQGNEHWQVNCVRSQQAVLLILCGWTDGRGQDQGPSENLCWVCGPCALSDIVDVSHSCNVALCRVRRMTGASGNSCSSRTKFVPFRLWHDQLHTQLHQERVPLMQD